MVRRRRTLKTLPGKVFVDTGAWIAGMIRKDQHHRQAREIWSRLRGERARLVTSTFVLDEALTFLRYREGRAAAVKLGRSILQSALVELIDVDRPCLDRAWDLFREEDELTLSFTDCTSFAVIETMDLRRVFAFDTDFRSTGAQLLP